MTAAHISPIGLLFLVGVAGATEPQIRIVTDGGKRPIAVEATGGWSKDELERFAKAEGEAVAELSQRLQIFVVNEKNEIQLPAMAGDYQVVGDAIRLTPRFPLRPGMAYKARFFVPARSVIAAPSAFSLDIKIPPAPPTEPTKVTAIYPSTSTLPDNQLRFYLHFSAPMSAGEALSHVKLLKADGQPVNRAFLAFGEELWDGSGQRLTLLFDPGRVKKGLKPREEFGPVLEAGQSYRLVIDKAWRDASGQPLAGGFEKHFTAGPAVETAVDFKQWKLTSPVAGSRGPLIVQFPRPLDRALLLRMITVADASLKRFPGEITVGDEERHWEFRPDQPWTAGKFALVVDTALEDSAGNNLARPFEVDVFDQVDKTSAPELIRIPFSVTAVSQPIK